MNPTEIVDAELATLYAKVEQLTRERDTALSLAERSAKTATVSNTKAEQYRRLFHRLVAHRSDRRAGINTYYLLTVQPDEPIDFRFATQEEFETVRDFAKGLPSIVIDEESTGAVIFNTASVAIEFLQQVWGPS